MLSFKINPNPIIILFTNTNPEDKFILGFLLFCIIAATFTTVTSYKKKEKIKTKQVSDDIKKYFEDNYNNIFNFVLIVIPIVFIICFGIFSVRYDAKKSASTLSSRAVFSTYSVYKIEQTVVYDSSGDIKSRKKEVLFKVYLKRNANNTIINKKSLYSIIFHNFVELDITKVNKDGFGVALPDGQATTIKKDDAPEVFNALNKIKSDEHYGEVMKMIRTREVTEEK